jgi:hypothetical protein
MPATSTVAALTLVLAANLTDAAVFPTDDANGNTRKATIAQMRTQLNTGAQIFTTTINVAGTSALQAVTATLITLTGDALVASMVATTSTSIVYQRFANGGGNIYLGAGSSTTGLFVGGQAYAASFGTESARGLDLATNNTVRLSIASGGAVTITTGLAVSGGGITVSGGTSSFLAVNITGNITNAGGVNVDVASGNIGLCGALPSDSDGFLTIPIKNGSAPSSSYAGGGILYSISGALKWRGSSGTITTIAAA